MHRPWIVVPLAVVTAVALEAQTPKPAFEVASIRKCENPCPTLAVPAEALRRRGGVRSNLTLAAWIRAAHGLGDSRVVGGPSWIRTDLFQIDARAGFEASAEQVQFMLRSLLEERFRLMTHVE